jgi:hypothetical protein
LVTTICVIYPWHSCFKHLHIVCRPLFVVSGCHVFVYVSDSMPQPRQRIVFCDCLDCVEQPAATDVPTASSAANEAAAKQEPPPKCLLLHLSGVLLPGTSSSQPSILEALRLPHLDKATREGCLTLLAARPDHATGQSTAS